MRALAARLPLLLATSLAIAGCTAPAGTGASTSAPDPDAPILGELRAFEADRRARTDFGALPPSDHRLGADPYAIRALPDGRFVGVLRGLDAVVLLNDQLEEIARAPAPASPVGVAIRGSTAYVVGEQSPAIHPFRIEKDQLVPLAPRPLAPETRALRDVAVGPAGALYAVDEERGYLHTMIPSQHVEGPPPGAPDVEIARTYEVTMTPTCAGAFRVARTKRAVLVDCLLAHRILAFRVDAAGHPQGAPAVIRNDGPLWSFDAIEDERGLLVASGGVENRALDRTHGSFENVDSFVYVDRVTLDPAPAATRLAEVNVSEHGVITPKALDLHLVDDGGFWIAVTGYGSGTFAELHFRQREARDPPSVVTFPIPPGTNAITRDPHENMVIANPLLDQWTLFRSEHIAGVTQPVRAPNDGERSVASRIGELLIFTDLIAPWNRSNGPLSRFTCETCHFEGYIDGRTHATGRGAVVATTKPLLGLFNNRPHFSRALDPDLSSVAHNEFRVAGARSGHDPVFDLNGGSRAWPLEWRIEPSNLTPVGLREAFMAFLMDFTHRSSPMTAGRSAFTEPERRGAAAFRDRCERCHEARLASDVPASRVRFEDWEARIFSPAAPIVWGQNRYEKTGVTPYVHDDGARIPSLRRLYKKHPYFTNGTAGSLRHVLDRVRFGPGAFFHDAAPADPKLDSLSPREVDDLESFLRLL